MSARLARPARVLAGALTATLLAGIAACSVSHENGQVFTTNIAGTGVVLSGFHDRPGEELVVEVLKAPALGTAAAESWRAAATVRAGTAPYDLNDPARPAYYWEATIRPSAIEIPAGDILRLRVRAGTRILDMFESTECVSTKVGAGASWATAGAECVSPFRGQPMTWVSATLAPSLPKPLPQPKYLTRDRSLGAPVSSVFTRDQTEDATGDSPAERETREYYARNPDAAPATLLAFERNHGLRAAGATTTFTPETVRAVYFNDADLGFGREMNCRQSGTGSTRKVACAVSNYKAIGAPSDAEALSRAVTGYRAGDHTGTFATVTMLFDAARGAQAVQFAVYGPDGRPLDSALLDSVGHNTFVPGNCLACHGGNASYDGAANVVSGAVFLPFDPESFGYASDADVSRAAMLPRIQALNALVLETNPTPAIRDLIGRFRYDGTEEPIPPGWDSRADDRLVYREVVKPYCRTCHVSFASTTPESSVFDFDRAAEFRTLRTLILDRTRGQEVTLVDQRLRSHMMPHAERTLDKFWKSPARAFLDQYLGAGNAGSWRP